MASSEEEWEVLRDKKLSPSSSSSSSSTTSPIWVEHEHASDIDQVRRKLEEHLGELQRRGRSRSPSEATKSKSEEPEDASVSLPGSPRPPACSPRPPKARSAPGSPETVKLELGPRLVVVPISPPDKDAPEERREQRAEGPPTLEYPPIRDLAGTADPHKKKDKVRWWSRMSECLLWCAGCRGGARFREFEDRDGHIETVSV